ncbi:MAG: hemolysin III family protein [Hyphomicrobiaceae bacterium]|nr:hemolysin III family protein [Hyphomicrobiaceae bacterium]
MMGMRTASGERLADDIIHVLGIGCGLAAATLLLGWAAANLPGMATMALAIYCAGLLAMLGCSGAYHMSRAVAWKGTLRRLDHAAIFLKIAGTYTPFALVKMGGSAGLALFVVVWVVALAGAAAKLLLDAQWDRLALAVYLALGWSGIATLQPLASSIAPASLWLLAAGGLIYSLGVVFFLWRSLPYHNAIWHLFVLIGTACHFGAVAVAVSQ